MLISWLGCSQQGESTTSVWNLCWQVLQGPQLEIMRGSKSKVHKPCKVGYGRVLPHPRSSSHLTAGSGCDLAGTYFQHCCLTIQRNWWLKRRVPSALLAEKPLTSCCDFDGQGRCGAPARFISALNALRSRPQPKTGRSDASPGQPLLAVQVISRRDVHDSRALMPVIGRSLLQPATRALKTLNVRPST